MDNLRAQLAAVTRKRDEAWAASEGGEPPEGSRLWRCERELQKAREYIASLVGLVDDEKKRIATAVEALEWYAEHVGAFAIDLHARKALAEIRGECTCDPRWRDMYPHNHDPECPQHGEAFQIAAHSAMPTDCTCTAQLDFYPERGVYDPDCPQHGAAAGKEEK